MKMNAKEHLENCIQMLTSASEINSININQRTANMQRRYERIEEIHQNKMKLNVELERKIEQERNKNEEIRTINENLDVEIIRVDSAYKKLLKNIEKLKSLNISRVKLHIGDNDKLRMSKGQIKLKLVKLLTRTYINPTMQGFSMDPLEGTLKPFTLNTNLPKETIRDVLWENIGECSSNKEKWEQLFS